MAEKLALSIERRDTSGSSPSRALRRSGKLPGVLYGHGSQPQAIAFERRAFEEMLHRGGHSSLVELTMNGSRIDSVLVRDVQIDPVSRKVIHVDLQRVSANESVRAKLPVATVGSPDGVRNSGGVMDLLVHELEVEGPADRLPDQLEIDVTELGIHGHVTAGSIELPSGFKMITGADTVVVIVEASKTARALEEVQAGTAEPAAPSLVGENEGSSA
jgi:large subunit ribosomal protein L25